MSYHPRTLHHYGFTVEVHRGGRRVWPPSFKRFIRKSLDQGDLSVDDVIAECNVSKSLVYKWRADVKGLEYGPSCPNTSFSEVVVQNDGDAEVPVEEVTPQIRLRGDVLDMCVPTDYPVADLVKLIAAFEGNVIRPDQHGADA